MENALQKSEPEILSIVPADVSAGALQSALAGDLSRLTEPDRLKFYGALCSFTGLNPLSKPFDWIVFQGKLTLYANKGCAEQLRKIHAVSVDIVERKVEFGCMIVRARAVDKDGRHDESIAAVPWGERMTGDLAALAMMKCETKAKRRVTLSICGLSLCVEREEPTEVAAAVESLPPTESVTGRLRVLNEGLSEKSEVRGQELEKTIELKPISQEPKVVVPEVQPIVSAAAVKGANVVADGSPVPVEKPEPISNSLESKPPASDDFNNPELLNETETASLQTALSEYKDPKRAVDYIVYRGWLAPGKDLAFIKRNRFVEILAKKKAFFLLVDGWKGTV